MSTRPAPLRENGPDDLIDPYAAEPPAQTSREWDSIQVRLMILEPGDHALLAKLLEGHPELRDEIIAEATPYVGNETVAKALEIASGTPAAAVAPPQATVEQDDEMLLLRLVILEPGDHELLATFLRSHPRLHDRIVERALEQVGEETVQQALAILSGAGEQQVEPAQTVEEPEPAPAADVTARPAETKVEPGWVTRARAYNRAHAALVEEFNALTGYTCVGVIELIDDVSDADQIDPNAVAHWQADHGVPPDGRVGPQTVEAARRARQDDQEQPAAPAPDLLDQLE